MLPSDTLRSFAVLRSIFSPGAPIDKYELFAGRSDQVRDVLSAVHGRGQHAILYGERGVGKTSLANILNEILPHMGHTSMSSGTVNCDPNDTFTTVWKKVFREILVIYQKKETIGFVPEPRLEVSNLQHLINTDQISPEDVRYIFGQLNTQYVIIIDELDRIEDPDVTRLLADTIKTLSDHSVPVTLILVGVADSVDQLIKEHTSIERALIQIRMPRMSQTELVEALNKCLKKAEMTIDDDAQFRIARLSEGLPHYTHLLGLHSAENAIEDGRTNITQADVTLAIQSAVSKAQQSILSAYHIATRSPRKESLFAQVLLACALAKTDDLGYFAAADVREPMSIIMGRRYEIPAFSQHLNDFCEPRRGPILQKIGETRRFRFRFINPLLQPYIIMKGLASGMINDAVLRQFSRSV